MKGHGRVRAAVERPASRTTRQLDATERALCASRTHPTAEEVFDAVRLSIPSISLATVYRNLQKLVAQDRARVMALTDRPARFDGRTDPHDHFVCRRCARVIDVERTVDRAQPRPRRVAGHRVQDLALTYFGSCAACDDASSLRAGG